MADRMLVAFTFLAALGAGLMAGVFFAFSTFVMRALARLPARESVSAMQSINVVVINPLFLGVFMGTAAVSVAAIITAAMKFDRPGGAYVIAGGVLYVVGTFLVTIVFNVPLNNALDAIRPDGADVAQRWAGYAGRWTAWNHVRAAAALAAAAAFTWALRQGVR